MNLKKTKLSFLIPILLLVLFYPASQSKADIAFDQNGKWETTFDCPEWEQGQSLNCNNLELAGGWTCNGQADQITSDANHSAGNGEKGFRHWEGDGSNVNGGGISAVFPSPQKEFWIRWYLRYEEGFKWSYLNYDKWLYIWTTDKKTSIIPEFKWANDLAIGVQGGPGPSVYTAGSGGGWNDIYGAMPDGSWFSVEIYVKMNSVAGVADGIGAIWINGQEKIRSTKIDYAGDFSSALDGWLYVLIGSNQASPENGRCMAVDYDDMVIYNQTPPNLDSQGNPFIGPVGWGEENSTLPGDLNSDGTVNIFDYNIFLQNFGATDCDNIADLNNDCNVNIFDYNIFLQNFGRSV